VTLGKGTSNTIKSLFKGATPRLAKYTEGFWIEKMTRLTFLVDGRPPEAFHL